MKVGWAASLLLIVSLAGCTKKSPTLVSRGRVVYQTNCTACHHTDPKKVGAIGPEVAGSSKDLLEARVLRGLYPPGYTPKRPTHLMAAFPFLKNDLDALHAFLNQ